ncbi:MAG TPA: hypothetical protein VF904_09385 [Anaeromyxobacteraceae bacterium]
MTCARADACSFVPILSRSHFLKVFQHLYCELDHQRCARMRMGKSDGDVPADMMPDGRTLSALSQPGR